MGALRRMSALPLPERPYVPGGAVARPALPEQLPPPPSPRRPLRAGDPHLCHGLDLFHHGFWWEAHECWETLWHGRDRGSGEGFLLQGLILLAAAHLQWSRGRLRGRDLLAERALARLHAAASNAPSDGHIAGLSPGSVYERFAPWLRRRDVPTSREALLAAMPRLV